MTKPITDSDFKKVLDRFLDSVLNRTYHSQIVQKMKPSQKIKVAHSCGKDLHLFIKKYTGIDTYKMPNEPDV